MARSSQMVQVGRRKFEITNLDKPLWPEDGIVKAELIEYYLKLAPTILAHVKGRPLTLVRFPDGIHEETFYQKNKPRWAPEWIEGIKIGTEKKIDCESLAQVRPPGARSMSSASMRWPVPSIDMTWILATL